MATCKRGTVIVILWPLCSGSESSELEDLWRKWSLKQGSLGIPPSLLPALERTTLGCGSPSPWEAEGQQHIPNNGTWIPLGLFIF